MSKRGENIYKRKDNRWEARYIQSYRPDGTAKYGYCYGKTYREAKQKTAAAKAALLTNRLSAAAAGGRFAKYCDEWLLLKRSCVKESTYVKYISVLEKHIKPGLGGCPVQSLSSVLVEQFGHELLCGKGLSAKTVRDILTILHSILRYTAKQCPEIAARVDVVYPKSVKKEMRVLSRGEQDRLVQYLLSDMDECKFGVLLSLLTGLRIGEVCAMRWEDISLQERAIYVSGTMQRLKSLENAQGKKTKIIITAPKSCGSERVIPLNDYALALCRRHFTADPVAFVLTGEAGRYVEPRTMQNRLKRYAEECGLSEVHFHALRHTFATRCVEVGFEIKSLSEILGHASPRFTLERYVHASLDLKRDNMNKLAAIGY